MLVRNMSTMYCFVLCYDITTILQFHDEHMLKNSLQTKFKSVQNTKDSHQHKESEMVMGGLNRCLAKVTLAFNMHANTSYILIRKREERMKKVQELKEQNMKRDHANKTLMAKKLEEKQQSSSVMKEEKLKEDKEKQKIR